MRRKKLALKLTASTDNLNAFLRTIYLGAYFESKVALIAAFASSIRYCSFCCCNFGKT